MAATSKTRICGDLAEYRGQYTCRHDQRYISQIISRRQVKGNGMVTESGTIDELAIGPGETKNIDPGYAYSGEIPGTEYFLEVNFVSKYDDGIVSAGTVVAREQFRLPGYLPAESLIASAQREIGFNETNGTFIVNGSDFTVEFSKQTGTMESWVADGKELLVTGPQPDFWRPPTDNDYGNEMDIRTAGTAPDWYAVADSGRI